MQYVRHELSLIKTKKNTRSNVCMEIVLSTEEMHYHADGGVGYREPPASLIKTRTKLILTLRVSDKIWHA